MKYSYHSYILSMLYLFFIVTMHVFSSSDAKAKGIFKCVKPNGEIEYTQSPSPECQDHNTTKMKNTGGRADPAAIAKQKEKRESSLKTEESRKIEELKKQDQKLVIQEKKIFCDNARKDLVQIQASPRLFKIDDQGNRIILTVAERENKIQTSKENISAHCR
ncbi:MAG: hypothetical protein AB8D52_05490 [Gammaproteobacteria bacterium]